MVQEYIKRHNSSSNGKSDFKLDSVEPTLLPEDGKCPFLPGNVDSDGDSVKDGEDFVLNNAEVWSIGSADAEDWSSPGHQSEN